MCHLPIPHSGSISANRRTPAAAAACAQADAPIHARARARAQRRRGVVMRPVRRGTGRVGQRGGGGQRGRRARAGCVVPLPYSTRVWRQHCARRIVDSIDAAHRICIPSARERNGARHAPHAAVLAEAAARRCVASARSSSSCTSQTGTALPAPFRAEQSTRHQIPMILCRQPYGVGSARSGR
jgi:hypothetical protein